MRKFLCLAVAILLSLVFSAISIVISTEQSTKSLSTEKLVNALIIYKRINEISPSDEVLKILRQEISCGVYHYWLIHNTLKIYKTVSDQDKAYLAQAAEYSSEKCYLDISNGDLDKFENS